MQSVLSPVTPAPGNLADLAALAAPELRRRQAAADARADHLASSRDPADRTRAQALQTYAASCTVVLIRRARAARKARKRQGRGAA